MSHVTRRRRPDGLVELRPREQHVDRSQWYMGAFSVLLFAWGLFISTAIPAQLVGVVMLGCLAGEVCLGLRALLELRRPRAEVLALAPLRRR